MRVVLGIGNPGSRYFRTRHNAGFMFLDYLASRKSISFHPSRSDYYSASGKIGEEEFLLVKPTTYVNNSGRAVKQIVENYNLNIDDLLVAVDDINIEEGKFNFKRKGSDGGHNGIKSIIFHLNSQDFLRLRIGVGQKFMKGEMTDYVLNEYSDEEFKKLSLVFVDCFDLVESFVEKGKKEMYDIYSRLSNKRSKSINSNSSEL